jgi:hypothetical protein
MSSRWIDNRLPLLIGLAALLFVLLTAPAHASEQWTRAAVVDAVAVTVTEVTEAELAQLRAKHERSHDRSALGRVVPMHRYGFAILHRNKYTGAFRCEVYIASLDPETLEHELRHCNGWVHP